MRMRGFAVGAGLRDTPHAKTTLNSCAIPPRSISEICAICEKIPRMESVCPFSSRSYMFKYVVLSKTSLRSHISLFVVLSKK